MTDTEFRLETRFPYTNALQLLQLGFPEPEVETCRNDSSRALKHMDGANPEWGDELVAAERWLKTHGTAWTAANRSFSLMGGTITAGHSASTPLMLLGVGQV
jgi:hypothetical protein